MSMAAYGIYGTPTVPLVSDSDFLVRSSESVKERIDASRLTVSELASRAGVCKHTVRFIRAGKHVYRLPIYIRLACALGCSVDELVGLS